MNPNILLIVFLATFYVPTPVQPQHPYELKSAIVDREHPTDGHDVFTLETYKKIEFAYIDNRISQVLALRDDGTMEIERFRTVDYHTMIYDVVIFDTGDPKRVVTCQFKNINDAKEFYRFLRPVDPVEQFYHTIKHEIIYVLQYDSVGAGGGNETCTDNYHTLSEEGRIYIEILTRSPKRRPLMKRFVIVGNDGATNMVFTSKTFNMKLVGNGEYAAMNIKTKYLSSEILIRFSNRNTAQRFCAYVNNYADLKRKMPLYISNSDIKSIFGDLFKSE